MDRYIKASEVSRNFSSLLRDVGDGETFVVTESGRPIARITAMTAPEFPSPDHRATLMARLRQQPTLDVGSWARGDLYE